jgi:16S rRNA (cytosine1402-N4)-methyltransferase
MAAQGPFRHIPVLLKEVVRLLTFPSPTPQAPTRLFVDCTCGGGGHAAALLSANPFGARLIGFDRDLAAVEAATAYLRSIIPLAQERARIIHSSYTDIKAHMPQLKKPEAGVADAILADLGLSSYQLDSAARGFSVNDETSLDMRFDSSEHNNGQLTAADAVNALSQGELARIFETFGEEPHASFIAGKIVAARSGPEGPIRTAKRLASVIASAAAEARSAASRNGRESRPPIEGVSGRTHPATRCFQALRIAVNGELDAVNKLLKTAPYLLRPGGRFAVITFHSLEDRLVKNAFFDLTKKSREKGGEDDARAAAAFGGTQKPKRKMKLSDPSPKAKDHFRFKFAEGVAYLRPTAEEVRENPRARSATLRCIERLGPSEGPSS